LGNQMFQYALSRSISIKNNSSVAFDVLMLHDHSSNHSNMVHRFFDLDIFELPKFDFVSKKESDYYNGIPSSSLIGKLKNRLVKIVRPLRLVLEKDKSFDSSMLDVKDDYCIVGSFQSPNYFEEYRGTLLEDFNIKEEYLDTESFRKHKKVIEESVGSVSIQVRRGDYVSNSLYRDMLGSQPVEYYLKAIQRIKEKVSNPQFFVFSDDIDWCKENFKSITNITYVESEMSKKGMASDLKLMSLCKHNIVSNSSFAWWGAWMNRNIDKVVIAPKLWVTEKYQSDMNVNPIDILPKKWIQL